MIKEYDGSLQSCEDILRVDKESFNEIKVDPAGLRAILSTVELIAF